MSAPSTSAVLRSFRNLAASAYPSMRATARPSAVKKPMVGRPSMPCSSASSSSSRRPSVLTLTWTVVFDSRVTTPGSRYVVWSSFSQYLHHVAQKSTITSLPSARARAFADFQSSSQWSPAAVAAAEAANGAAMPASRKMAKASECGRDQRRFMTRSLGCLRTRRSLSPRRRSR